MNNKLIFLSHIYEERELAAIIKEAIESEFAGFVEVFVSSDGTSIPAGSNFLKRIEDGLINCIGALYLISPTSVKRNWINFELGAVWIRNTINIKQGSIEIPTLPICHSGMTPSNLPLPIGNLNAIAANQASQLEFAFRSLQTATGGKGPLRTNFDTLAQRVILFERRYTLGTNVKTLLTMLGGDKAQLIKDCESLPPDVTHTTLDLGFISTEIIQKVTQLENNELSGKIRLSTKNPGLTFTTGGAVNGAKASLLIEAKLITEFKDIL